MSGETFPTVLWFKSYSKNSRVLTVLWDTLYYHHADTAIFNRMHKAHIWQQYKPALEHREA